MGKKKAPRSCAGEVLVNDQIYFLSLALSSIQVGVAYAIWAGLGIVLITLIGAVAFKEVPDLPAVLGLSMIIAGVFVINIFSKTVTH